MRRLILERCKELWSADKNFGTQITQIRQMGTDFFYGIPKLELGNENGKEQINTDFFYSKEQKNS